MRNATQTTVSVFGTLMGLAGIEHGVGEMLQGRVAPGGLMFPSWPGAPFFKAVNGEPAMSILPDMLLTGVLAILFSLAYITWVTWLLPRRRTGLVLIGLALGMLLFGGGIFPPLLAFIIALVATFGQTPRVRRQGRSVLGAVWPALLRIGLPVWLLLCPGVGMLDYFFGVNNDTLTVTLILLALVFLGLALAAGLRRDRELVSEP